MRKWIGACVIGTAMIVSGLSLDTWAAPAAEVAATIKKTLESRFPGAHVMEVQPSAIPGIYEVFMGDQIVYVDPSADYLLIGPLVDTQTRTNLTEARLNDLGRIDFRTLPFDRAIKVVKGNGSRKFAVFSDPDCPFCQELEKTLLSVTDVTMYVFLYPIASLHPQAPVKAHAIWCAKDRVAAWSQWMHEKKLPPATTCAGDPIDELQQLGNRLRINSTPTLFFANGRRVAGAIPEKDIERLLTNPSDTKPPADVKADTDAKAPADAKAATGTKGAADAKAAPDTKGATDAKPAPATPPK
jgi:thiol:disulfide interchange protein DsbC